MSTEMCDGMREKKNRNGQSRKKQAICLNVQKLHVNLPIVMVTMRSYSMQLSLKLLVINAQLFSNQCLQWDSIDFIWENNRWARLFCWLVWLLFFFLFQSVAINDNHLQFSHHIEAEKMAKKWIPDAQLDIATNAVKKDTYEWKLITHWPEWNEIAWVYDVCIQNIVQ